MNIDDYNLKCEELSLLAKEALELKDLDARTTKKLENIREDIIANHYRITLLGAYQGGKSTIFDAACGDGRELSPTGFGIRTSAVPAEAYAIEEGKAEYAFITWKNNDELLSGFIEAIAPEVRDLGNRNGRKELSDASDIELVRCLDLNQLSDRSLLVKANTLARKHYEEEKAKCYGVSTTRYELIRIGQLILRHMENFIFSVEGAVDQRTKVTVEEASRIVRFPVGWETDERTERLKWDDLKFLFARSASFYLVSKDLTKLKATLVDCPGFNASKWDNDIVHECVAKSDAIIWLQGTEGKEMSLSDLDEARKFSDYGITQDGVFVAFNARGMSEFGVRPIVESNLSKMRQELGMNFSANHIPIFNALLALRSKQAIAIKDGRLSHETIEALSEKAMKQIDPDRLPDKGKNSLENAKYLISADLRKQSMQFLDEPVMDVDSAETIKALMWRSGWSEVIEQAARFVMKTKGYSRLINRGARPLLDVVSEYEQKLKDSEDIAKRSLDEHQTLKNDAEQALNDFESKADGLLRPYERDLEKVVRAEEGIGSNIRGELLGRFTSERNRNSLIRNLENAVDEAAQERDVISMVRAVAVDWMKQILTGWHNDVRAGKSAALRAHQEQEIDKLEGRMKEFLRRAVEEGGGLLGGSSFNMPEIEDQILADYEAKAMSPVQIDKWLDRADKIKIFYNMRNGYEWIRTKISGNPFNREVWKNKLSDYQQDLMGVLTDEIIYEMIKDFLGAYFESIISQIEATKRSMREEYEARVHEAEMNVKQSHDKKQALTSRSQEIRKEVLRPFRKKVDQFIKNTEKVLSKPTD